MEQTDPYSLEPVINEQELMGRKTVLNRLIAAAKSSNIGSSIIHGQKRVGKTSVARVLQSYLTKMDYTVIYLEAGDYIDPTAKKTISGLGVKLCNKIREYEPRVAHLSVPQFGEALSPLTEFMDEVERIVPGHRLVIILDEFDQLPLDLYLRGSLGDAFFLTLRSISSRPNIGFILVGGERMTHIMDCQGIQLNKWGVIQVDYFTRDSDWPDYRELIQHPVTGTLEYSEDALIALHDITAGNPYFTKLVCQQVFREAVAKRDCYIARAEIARAIEAAVRESKLNTFQHFWEDGIFETGERATEKSIRRRKILIALIDVLSKQAPVPFSLVSSHPLVKDIPTLENDLKEFVTRKILVCNLQDDSYDIKVRLFHEWLKRCGIQDIIATFSDLDAVLKQRQQDEKLKILPEEIIKVIDGWGLYKGQQITETKVRIWLDQFEDVRDQRAMFSILQRLHFYGNLFVRKKLAEANDVVTRGLIRYLETRKFKRSDILVSYLDSPAKSGSQFARLYADEAEIYVDNVIAKEKLLDTIREKSDIKAIVFVDDFVGTGEQSASYLSELMIKLLPVVRQRNIKVVFIPIVAYIEGLRKIEALIQKQNLPVILHACVTLDESSKCFGDNSIYFEDSIQREYAMRLAERIGKKLEKDCPLGYGNLQLALTFEHSCPNDSLPILWSESSTPKWIPLFKRN